MNPRHQYELDAKYNSARGYSAHHWDAITSVRIEPLSRLDHLGRNGYEMVRVMDPDLAGEYVGTNVSAGEIGKDRLRAVLAEVFNPSLDAKLISYFLSFYAVLFWNIQASDEANPSLRWHCDAGPSSHLKLLVYLNETSGATELIDRNTTSLFKRIGYGFGAFEDRVEDISALGREHEIYRSPSRLSPSPGNAVLFEPSQVLHRGVYPKEETRWIMQIGLIPWNTPWNENLDDVYETISGNHGFGFPTMSAL